MSKRLPAHMLDPGSVTDGDYVVSVAGGKVTGLSPAPTGGGGGGGGAIHYADDLGGTNFTTTTGGSYVTVSGLSLTITPAAAGVLTLTFSGSLNSTLTGALNAKLMCSPTPTIGPTSARFRNESATSNKPLNFSITRHYKLAAGVAYTFSTQVYQAAAGTLTLFGDQESTELSGVFIPI